MDKIYLVHRHQVDYSDGDDQIVEMKAFLLKKTATSFIRAESKKYKDEQKRYTHSCSICPLNDRLTYSKKPTSKVNLNLIAQCDIKMWNDIQSTNKDRFKNTGKLEDKSWFKPCPCKKVRKIKTSNNMYYPRETDKPYKLTCSHYVCARPYRQYFTILEIELN